MIKTLLLVGAGGFAGSILRYLISVAMTPAAASASFPLGTLLVNAAGSLLMGLLLGALPQNGWYYFGAVGFCGGFTTFSTFSLEAFRMLRNGEWLSGGLYAVISVVICILFVWLGALVSSRLVRTA